MCCFTEDEEWEERLRILEDARQLKQVAEFFLHPEEPVQANSSSRCYFDRAAAPEVLSEEEAEERAAVLEEAAALKKLAVDFLHPEQPVQTTDAFAFGRNYFTRASAPEQEEDAEERALIMADLKALKQSAVDYLHPEIPIQTTDPTACGRNYFTRASAPAYETEEEAEERERVMADLQALKQSAVDFMHPEIPVKTTDPTACGRNYFTRASAPEFEDPEEAAARAQVMEDLQQLKQAALDYLHPEISVKTTDSTARGRNYFSRASAPEYESLEDAEIRAQVMEDMHAFKQLAVDFLHPELPVKTTDSTARGRNYFSRASAPEYESEEDAEVRAQILEDAAAFKQLASDYLHPELPVVIYATVTGRNFFARASGPEYESLEDAEIRAQVMQDMRAFKQLAVDYLHPELPAVVYATAHGRNYFSRPTAAPTETPEEAEERAQIMADLKALKQSAVNFLHPELPVETTSGIAMGRNYFSRPSAPELEDLEEAKERALIMADLKALKQSAVHYLHPELPVETTDPFACGRNYFSRPSAPELEDLGRSQGARPHPGGSQGAQAVGCALLASGAPRQDDVWHCHGPQLLWPPCVYRALRDDPQLSSPPGRSHGAHGSPQRAHGPLRHGRGNGLYVCRHSRGARRSRLEGQRQGCRRQRRRRRQAVALAVFRHARP